ncbi:MAG: hypothetical protein F6J92_37865 [Symploca sp. SIO1A3]|nr:hypothetical protein [Symploca sp. SIO1A3]
MFIGSIIGRAPIVNSGVGGACYFVGVTIMVSNICFSQRYFHAVMAPNGGELTSLQWWASWGISVAMGLFEAAMIGFATTPVAWGVIFSVPKRLNNIIDDNQRQVAKAAAVTCTGLLGVAVAAVYLVDYRTTYGGLGISDKTAAMFLASCLVAGSEVLFLAGNACQWFALISRAETADLKNKLNQEIKSAQAEEARTTAQFNGSAHAPARTPRR